MIGSLLGKKKKYLDKRNVIVIVLGMANRSSVIRRYALQQSGPKGGRVTLAQEWIDDHGLRPGVDDIEESRDEEDRLVLTPIKKADQQ
jgi:hypothetical protein